MSQITKYLLFICMLAVASYCAANFEFDLNFGGKRSGTAKGSTQFRPPQISKKPSAVLQGFAGEAVIDYSPLHGLTAAAADDGIRVWQFPETKPDREIVIDDGFQALTIRFISPTSLVAVGGINGDFTGSIRFFDAATGERRMQIDEPEPIQHLDPHPGGKLLLATAETYIKVLDMKDGNTLSVLQKSNPASLGYYYGNGKYILQSDSLALFDLEKRTETGTLDTRVPLLFRKGRDGKSVSWLSADGVTVASTAGGGKKFYPIASQRAIAFDIEPGGTWGLFLNDPQKLSVIELSGGKLVKTIDLASPASDVTINGDGTAAFVQYASGTIAVYDIGYRNRLKSMQHSLTKLVGGMKNRQSKPAEPEQKP